MTDVRGRAPTGERADLKRRAIVEAAREVFLARGFEAGIDLIAQRADVSKVTIYNHFGSKRELFLAVVHDALEEALEQPKSALRTSLEESDDIREVLVRTARGWVAGMAQPQVLALRTLVASEAQRFPELGAAWKANGPGPTSAVLAEEFRRRIDLGELDIPDIELALVQLYALVLYPHFAHIAYGERIDEKRADELVDRGVDMFLGYYSARR
ncbi:TetR/AcrR family transcriptional regulator [Pseudonocardia lacus]|uniref:TetR/AcrR family transcriptional regulator n=1 Tax=Pseudonocardia lacus TaxID=2835865 RepID=UPI001BDC573B|nr:TetR/AcrR family transcriptional regulator [Pseudonocardia lacus]